MAAARSSGVPHDLVELVGVREQGEEQVAERAVGGLDAGRQQQPEEGEDLLVGEPVPVDLGLDELADEIVARPGATFGNPLGEVVAQGVRRRDASVPVDERC